jgi:DNA replication protein DnaC
MERNLGHALMEGTFNHKLKSYVAPSVLVIDDVGLIPMERAEATAFFQVVNRRYETGHSTIVTTNCGLPEWGEILGDPVVAAAILDRLMHRETKKGGAANLEVPARDPTDRDFR